MGSKERHGTLRLCTNHLGDSDPNPNPRPSQTLVPTVHFFRFASPKKAQKGGSRAGKGSRLWKKGAAPESLERFTGVGRKVLPKRGDTEGTARINFHLLGSRLTPRTAPSNAAGMMTEGTQMYQTSEGRRNGGSGEMNLFG